MHDSSDNIPPAHKPAPSPFPLRTPPSRRLLPGSSNSSSSGSSGEGTSTRCSTHSYSKQKLLEDREVKRIDKSSTRTSKTAVCMSLISAQTFSAKGATPNDNTVCWKLATSYDGARSNVQQTNAVLLDRHGKLPHDIPLCLPSAPVSNRPRSFRGWPSHISNIQRTQHR